MSGRRVLTSITLRLESSSGRAAFLDPASSEEANKIVQAAQFYSKEDDGLTGRLAEPPLQESDHRSIEAMRGKNHRRRGPGEQRDGNEMGAGSAASVENNLFPGPPDALGS